jgi:hypothetical protein
MTNLLDLPDEIIELILHYSFIDNYNNYSVINNNYNLINKKFYNIIKSIKELNKNSVNIFFNHPIIKKDIYNLNNMVDLSLDIFYCNSTTSKKIRLIADYKNGLYDCILLKYRIHLINQLNEIIYSYPIMFYELHKNESNIIMEI